MFGRRSPPTRSGSIDLAFTAASADDGYHFDVHANGQWEADDAQHHDPSAAACHVIDAVVVLAADCPILAGTELEFRANARLGRPANLADPGVRVQWPTVHVHARPEDLQDARARARIRAAESAAREEQRLRVTQYVQFRDLLREDPTSALAQLLLETPATVSTETVTAMDEIARQVAATAPGAARVETARLPEKSFSDLPTDAEQFIIDRLCTVLMEFGAKEPAERLRTVHSDTRAKAGWEART
ncbi:MULTISPECIES: hypothetical protein [Streptomyces]|uniref:Uncharacterized protein n=2 Tax=Streptomyces TaxID=1883 RepID=A0ABV9J9V0_9ACTN